MSEVTSKEDKLEKQLQLLAENVNSSVYNQRKYLLGRVLTIVDAVASDPEQRKAIKDVVQDLFYQDSYWNDIKWHFNQIRKANGIKEMPSDKIVPTQEPLNIYKEV